MATLDLKQLEDKPWYYGLGIGVFVAVVLYAAAYYQLPNFSEMKQTLENKKNELDQLNQKITQGRAAERRLPQLREEVRRTELDLQRLLQILPTARNAEELIKKIQALAGQGEFFLKKWTPKEYVNKDFYAEWPIDLQIDGTYHNLALFFEKVARFSRIINIEDLVMTGYPDAAGGRTLGANFTMKTLIYLGETDAGAPATAAAPAETPAPGAPGKVTEQDFTPSVYTYEVGGRRDPFRSLLVRNPSEKDRVRPPGLAGIMVDELELQGTIKVKQAWVAMMRSPDNKSHLVR